MTANFSPAPLPPPSHTDIGDSITVATPETGLETSACEPPTSPRKRSVTDTPNVTTITTGALKDALDLKPPAKKVKLSEAERQAREVERQTKEEKRKEKETREQEKATKKAERDEKKRIRDEEKRKKDEEKRRKEEEKARKERSQLRVDSFFAKPKLSSPTKYLPVVSSPTDAIDGTKASSPEVEKKQESDYEVQFKSFYIKHHVTVAPVNWFEKDQECKAAICKSLDEALSQQLQPADTMDIDAQSLGTRRLTKEEAGELFQVSSYREGRRGNLPKYSTKDVLARINAPDDPSLPPLTKDGGKEIYNSAYYVRLLNSLPAKFLKFSEDIRPPYIGTYARKPTDMGLLRGRNPFRRAMPYVNYDYDSEAEWVPEEEGEDLLSDEEDEEDLESVDDDMEDFLDDEGDVGLRRRGGIGTLVAASSGLCWEDANGKNERPDLEEMRLGVLLAGLSTPIDPFSTIYWESPLSKAHLNIYTGAMEPPRRPFALNNKVGVSTPVIGDNSKKARPTVPEDQLESFKRAIEGSDMTKAGLVEVLKKQFSKIPKAAIQNTLGMVAARVGDKQEDKRWVLL